MTAGIILISFFAGDRLVNSQIQVAIHKVFGIPAFLVPFALLFLATFFIRALKFKSKRMTVFVGLVLLIATLSCAFHLFQGDGAAAMEMAMKGKGGGLVGYYSSQILKGAVSLMGALLVVAAALVISAILMFEITLDQLVGFFSWVGSKIKLAALGILGILPKKESDEDDGGELVISPGADGVGGMQFGEASPELVSVVRSAAVHGTAGVPGGQEGAHPGSHFEIVPSMSEPQQEGNGGGTSWGGGDMVTSLAPNALPYSNKVWETPPLDLLGDAPDVVPDSGDIQIKAKIIKDTLSSFGIDVDVADVQQGPSVTQYALSAKVGTKISKISTLQHDLALALASPTGSVRIEAPIPGKSLIGIEVPNTSRVLVHFKSLLTADPMKNLKSKLGIVLGKDVAGGTRVYDIDKMPHLLVAGSTGSGKSVFIHSVIFSMLFRASPQEVKFILIDPKRVELVHYHGIPHLYAPVVTDVDKAPSVFRWAVIEMERRYKLFESAKVRNIAGYNEKSGFQALPYIMIIVDELAEIILADPKGVESSVVRVAQMARATGLHLILATQRPSTNVISGLIKANIPSRIAFGVTSQIDSRVIIDQPGAEKLLGQGDMLFVPPDVQKPIRLQAPFISDKEISNLVNWLKNTGVKPDYRNEIFEVAPRVYGNGGAISGSGSDSGDDKFNEAVELVTSLGKASASLLQRRLSIGYARAARIIDEMEEKGIIGPQQGSKPRDILSVGGIAETSSAGGNVPTHNLDIDDDYVS